MNVIRDYPAARWLPERHHFALMRLIAFLRMRFGSSPPMNVDRLVLSIDRDQSAIENYSISIWIFVTLACYVASLLPYGTLTATAISIPLTLTAIQFMIAIGGLIQPSYSVNSVIFMSVVFLASSYFATASSPVRYVAWLFFAVVVLNTIAWIIAAALMQVRNLIIGFAWISPFVLIILWPRAPITGLGIMAVSHILLLYPTLRPNVQWLGPVMTRFEASDREVWLTIDDGPSDDTPAILELLAARSVKATFFVKGTSVEQRPDLARAILGGGHLLANHSYSHPSATFWCLPPASIAAEIDRCNAVIGTQRYLRAPVGMKNPAVHDALQKRDMRLIGWSACGFDTIRGDAERVAARIVSRVEPGAIVVMHQGRPQSLQCIARVIDRLQAVGYSFVIPSEDRLKMKK
jgi:peptidoglycan/xylan/chitin deacetylase (PgdA/CDA1 family)